jgi:hypothetical protein
MRLHTPTPWFISGLEISTLQSERIAVCDCDEPNNLPGYSNAEFIVRAVNCHDELLAALKDLLGDMPDMREVDGATECRHCGRRYRSYHKRDKVPVDATECSDDCPGYIARAALAKATGGAA